MPANDCQQIVEVMSHAASQASQGIHLLRLPKLAFQLFSLRFIPLQRSAHAIKRLRQLRQFIAPSGLQRIREIAAFQCVNTIQQRGQRLRDGVRDQKDQRSTRNNCHQPESQQQIIQAPQVRLRFAIGFQHENLRRRLQLGRQVERLDVVSLVAQRKLRCRSMTPDLLH